MYRLAECKRENLRGHVDVLEHVTDMLHYIQSSSTRNKQSHVSVITELIAQLESAGDNVRIADGSS